MGKYSMLSIDKVFHASVVLKNIVRDTAIVPTEGITEDCQLFLKPENLQTLSSGILLSSALSQT